MEKRDSVKSHDDIMAMFRELEDLERRLRGHSPASPEGSHALPMSVEPSPEIALVEPTPEIVPVEPAFETAPVAPSELAVEKRHKRLFKQSKREPRVKRSLFARKVKTLDAIEVVRQIHPTFSLHLDDEGNLLGFDQPKPKPSKGLEPPSGRFGKLLSRFSRKKSGEDAGGSKLGGLLGKLKIRGRREKE